MVRKKLKSSFISATGNLIRVSKSPEEALGELFSEVQHQRIYDDGKTFVDLVPKRRTKRIKQEYDLAKQDPDFDLREFLTRHFHQYEYSKGNYQSDPNLSSREHISKLWDVLKRQTLRQEGSLIVLPHPYIVPGGRFSEQFYWDSYFIMLGLAVDNRWDMIDGMIKNYTFMIRKFGFIPTANRSYFTSRSQPPFFSHMVRLLARKKGYKTTIISYLPYLIAEYRFWMRGWKTVNNSKKNTAYSRLVKMPNGFLLNRYYDNKTSPRPESHREDVETAYNYSNPKDLYLHLRAGAESGWDFSSRWLRTHDDISTIHTTDIVPVDLNCLLYEMEITIARGYRYALQPIQAKRYEKLAKSRLNSIQKFMWNEERGFFMDYNFIEQKQTPRMTLAGVFPLFSKVATQDQAERVAAVISRDFLKEGGLVTTTLTTGQQWDAPNGWAPLHWVVIQGLRNYGLNDLANEIKERWLYTNEEVYKTRGKMIEKYDVVSPGELGGGGEYPLQDGFGWTNGVMAALMAEDD